MEKKHKKENTRATEILGTAGQSCSEVHRVSLCESIHCLYFYFKPSFLLFAVERVPIDRDERFPTDAHVFVKGQEAL